MKRTKAHQLPTSYPLAFAEETYRDLLRRYPPKRDESTRRKEQRARWAWAVAEYEARRERAKP